MNGQCGLNFANDLITTNLDQCYFNQKDFDEIDFKKATVMNKTLSG